MYVQLCILQFDVFICAFYIQQQGRIHILMKDNNKKELRLFMTWPD